MNQYMEFYKLLGEFYNEEDKFEGEFQDDNDSNGKGNNGGTFM